MFRTFGKRLEIVRNAYARVYVGSDVDRYWVPYRLQPVDRARQKVANECLQYILDSGFKDPTVTNEEILQKATEVNPNYIIPKDYLPWDAYNTDKLPQESVKELRAVRKKYDGDFQAATTDSILEFLDLWEQSPTSGRPIIPLQPNHVEHYRSLPERVKRHSYFSIGGIAHAGPEKQVHALREFREEIGYHVQVHALGVGTHLKTIRAIRDDPALVDSLDVSTPEQTAKNESIPDKSFKQPPDGSFKMAKGKNSSTTRAAWAEAVYLHLCYAIGPFCDDDLYEQESDEDRYLGTLNNPDSGVQTGLQKHSNE
jgi:8-oxo-dGTP pyrophosphatase MutT (NUDIX family)